LTCEEKLNAIYNDVQTIKADIQDIKNSQGTSSLDTIEQMLNDIKTFFRLG
jgi:hypothetical protein